MDEQKKRKTIFNKKMKRAGILLIISFAGFFAAGLLPPFLIRLGCGEGVAKAVNLLFRGVYSFGTIAAVMMFVRTLHDPLTEEEAKELEEKERLEKTDRR